MIADQPVETWSLRKPAVVSERGLVATQHHRASDIGAEVLRTGGNAVDAAVAASLAVGVLEPWMSGLGGGGQMLVYVAAQDRTWAVDFGMVAPHGLNPRDYPLAEGRGADLFNWPAVHEDRNLRGYPAMAVPGYVAGIATALERFGTRSWAESLNPAIEIAEQGLPVDWYATVKIASAARFLTAFAETRRVYLPDGFPPCAQWSGPLPRIRPGRLSQTLQRLATAGPRDFYAGEIAQQLLADTAAGGSTLAAKDLSAYRARVLEPPATRYRDAFVLHVPGLTAGPSLARALELLGRQWTPDGRPDAAAFCAYAQCLLETYAERLALMGDCDEVHDPSCTTHLSVVDAAGNMVALTQTLLSVFGSKVVLPRTGVLMNNGIMWFDPRPGRPNSIRPGRRPLSNMCPAILVRDDGQRFAMGAAGGRRILPAVMQLISFLVDYRMGVGEAVHHPRIDVSGTPTVAIDRAMPGPVAQGLAARFDTRLIPHGVHPSLFAAPGIVGRDRHSGRCAGAVFVPSPWSKVSGA